MTTQNENMIAFHIITNIKAGNPEMQETQLFPFVFMALCQ
jgi:hypothetical protein